MRGRRSVHEACTAAQAAVQIRYTRAAVERGPSNKRHAVRACRFVAESTAFCAYSVETPLARSARRRPAWACASGGRVLRQPGRIPPPLDVCGHTFAPFTCPAACCARNHPAGRRRAKETRVCRHFFVCQRRLAPWARRRFQRKHLAGGLLQVYTRPWPPFLYTSTRRRIFCFGALRRNEHHPFVYLFIFDAGGPAHFP